MGTCILSQISEQETRLYFCMVERRELGRCRVAFWQGKTVRCHTDLDEQKMTISFSPFIVTIETNIPGRKDAKYNEEFNIDLI